MASQLGMLATFSVLVATVLAFVMRAGSRERLRFGIMVFLAFVLSALAVGWLMYPFPR
jgi:hypothetical protein